MEGQRNVWRVGVCTEAWRRGWKPDGVVSYPGTYVGVLGGGELKVAVLKPRALSLATYVCIVVIKSTSVGK